MARNDTPKPVNPYEISSHTELADIVTRIQAILWLEKGTCEHCGSCVDIWNPDKQWNAETADLIAMVLSDHGLRPDCKAPSKD